MPLYRAMVIFENQSALPEDRFVNTWFFDHAGDKEQAASDILQKVGGFYQGASPNSVSNFMSSIVSRATGASQLRVYDMADAEPREPEIINWTLSAGGSGTDLPNEVAACMSFYADRNLPRKRGRLYLGPLKDSATTSGASDRQLSTQFIAAIQNGLNQLVDAAQVSPASWRVFSRAAVDDYPVTNVWVDNALDTQRRRGADATTRTSFTLAQFAA